MDHNETEEFEDFSLEDILNEFHTEKPPVKPASSDTGSIPTADAAPHVAVNLADKFCATLEVVHLYQTRRVQRWLPTAAWTGSIDTFTAFSPFSSLLFVEMQQFFQSVKNLFKNFWFLV